VIDSSGGAETNSESILKLPLSPIAATVACGYELAPVLSGEPGWAADSDDLHPGHAALGSPPVLRARRRGGHQRTFTH